MSAEDFFFGSLPPSERWRLPERPDTEPAITARWIAPPAEAFLPADDPRHLQLGWGQTPEGHLAPVGIRHDELRFGVWIVGQMGTGKSETLKRLCRQLIAAQIGFLALDGKSMDLADDTVRLIPREREGEVVVFDLEGTEVQGERLIPTINLLSPAFGRSLGLAPDLLASLLLHFFAALDPSIEEQPAALNITKMAVLALLEGEGQATLWHLKRFLGDEGYRRQVCQAVTNVFVRDFWMERWPEVNDADAEPLLALWRSLEGLLGNPVLALLFIAPTCAIPLRELMDTGGMVLGGAVGRDGDAARLGQSALLVQALLSGYGRLNVSGAEDADGFCPARPDFHLLLDEAPVLLHKQHGLMRMLLCQLRPARLGVVLISQSGYQFGEGLSEELRRVPYRVMLGATRDDAEVWARENATVGLLPKDFREQERHLHQRIRVRGCGTAFSTRVLGRAMPYEEADPEPVEQDWHIISAPAQSEEDRQLDEAIRQFRELAAQRREVAIRRLGQLCLTDPAAYARYCERTRAHRHAQRAFILAHPGAIPDKAERIRTLSALWIGVPALEIHAYQWALEERVWLAVFPDLTSLLSLEQGLDERAWHAAADTPTEQEG